jgi:hypothetical protein
MTTTDLGGLVAVAPPTANASAVYRRASAKDGFPTLEVSTLYELFSRSVEKYGDLPALGRRPIDKARPPGGRIGRGASGTPRRARCAGDPGRPAAAGAAAGAARCTLRAPPPPATTARAPPTPPPPTPRPLHRRRTLQDGNAGDYVWTTYAEAGAAVSQIASALSSLGLAKADRVGVYGANCCEWMIAMQVRRKAPNCMAAACGGIAAAWNTRSRRMARAEATARRERQRPAPPPPSPRSPMRAPPTRALLKPASPALPTRQACNRMSYECVPLYDSLGENAIEYIMRHSEMAAAFVAGPKAGKLAQALSALQARGGAGPRGGAAGRRVTGRARERRESRRQRPKAAGARSRLAQRPLPARARRPPATAASRW